MIDFFGKERQVHKPSMTRSEPKLGDIEEQRMIEQLLEMDSEANTTTEEQQLIAIDQVRSSNHWNNSTNDVCPHCVRFSGSSFREILCLPVRCHWMFNWIYQLINFFQICIFQSLEKKYNGVAIAIISTSMFVQRTVNHIQSLLQLPALNAKFAHYTKSR